MNEPIKKTFYIVKLGGRDLYFERLEEASSFFAKIVNAPITILKSADGSYRMEKYCYKTNQKIEVSMETKTVDLYNNKEEAEFDKHKNTEKDKEDDE